jgi:hypothetical protein
MALGLLLGVYGYSFGLAGICYSGLFKCFKTKRNFYSIFNKLCMRNNSILYPVGEKAMITFMHFTDFSILGGLLYGFIASVGDWQAGIYLGVFIMFAILRGASLLEDINSKREQRRAKKIDNDQHEWENNEKRKSK